MTQTLALVFSGYMLVAALKILFDPDWYLNVIEGLQASAALSFLCGVFIYFIGALFLVLHYSFATPLAGFVTVFTILMAAEGLAIMLVPKLILALPAGIGFQHHSKAWGGFALLLGLGLGTWALI
jgi:hypothetical protein